MDLCGWTFAPMTWWQNLESGTAADWAGAIATFAAVVVALSVALGEARRHRRERRGEEAAVARRFAVALIPAEVLLPKAVEHWEKQEGRDLGTPGSDQVYGVDACSDILRVSHLVERLPFFMVEHAAAVISYAQSWSAEIAALKEFKQWSDAARYAAVAAPPRREEAIQIAERAKELRRMCNTFCRDYDRSSSLVRWYLFGGRHEWQIQERRGR